MKRKKNWFLIFYFNFKFVRDDLCYWSDIKIFLIGFSDGMKMSVMSLEKDFISF